MTARGRAATGQQKHGTVGGYQMHVRYKTVPCLPCLAAKAARSRMKESRRNFGKCARGLGWPLLRSLYLRVCGEARGTAGQATLFR